jgi:hypothetical protein
MEAGQNVWYNSEEIFTLALPAPIAKLMQVFISKE